MGHGAVIWTPPLLASLAAGEILITAPTYVPVGPRTDGQRATRLELPALPEPTARREHAGSHDHFQVTGAEM